MNDNTVAVFSLVCLTVLFIVFAGEPDLMDALVSYLSKP